MKTSFRKAYRLARIVGCSTPTKGCIVEDFPLIHEALKCLRERDKNRLSLHESLEVRVKAKRLWKAMLGSPPAKKA